MSPNEAFERIKNWQRSQRALILTLPNLAATGPLDETRVSVMSADESTLLLVMLGDPFQSESRSLAGAVFATTDGADLDIKFADGWEWHLREES